MSFKALSPVAERDPVVAKPLAPRLDTLNGKTIGLFASFKEHWVYILDEIGRQLQDRFDNVKLTRFRYTKDLNAYTTVAEVGKDLVEGPKFEEWIKTTDAVIVANADAGSCTLYLSFNASQVENLGKPGVLTVQTQFLPLAKRGLELRGVPHMRTVDMDLYDISLEPELVEFCRTILPGKVSAVLDSIVDALVAPPQGEEAELKQLSDTASTEVISGSLQEINNEFYKRGWAPGVPIIPPTAEAVQAMYSAVNLSPDAVIGRLPPSDGKATVEKIAINAIMAGCLPTHMPVLIAAVQAMIDPNIWIEAYTTSMASWMPMLIVNGPVRNDIDVNYDTSYMSPYKRANAAIGRALGLIIMNISGVRAKVEDMGVVGHEGHFGVCIGEHEEASPWEPLHEFQGLEKNDSAVSLFFPNTRLIGPGLKNAGALLQSICEQLPVMGFDPGCAVIISPATAKVLAEAGLSRKNVADYIVEYARRPASQMNVRWMRGNQHDLGIIPLPLDPTRSTRKIYSTAHLPIIVAGNRQAVGFALYGGGGDHGGPITKKIELPENWPELVEQYKAVR